MLTDANIKKLKRPSATQKAADKHSFGHGLRLFHYANDKKIWFIEYRHDNKQKSWKIGTYPLMTLAAALKARDDAKLLREQGIDPKAYHEDKAASEAAIDTFKIMANEWLERQSYSESTKGKSIWLLEFAFAVFGQIPINQITPVMILKACRIEEEKGHLETAQRIKTKCSQVFRYAVAIGKLERDPTADLRGALKTPQVTNRAAITDIKSIPAFLKDIDQYNGDFNTIHAFKLAPLVFVRPGELRGALWADIDLEAGEWLYTPPKTRNKTRLQLIVPLSKQTIEIFRELHKMNGHSPYVFYSSKAVKHGIMSENTLNQAMRAMGYSSEEMCGHGFRAMAKTILKGHLKYSEEATELQLGHQIKNIHGTAYDRWAYLEERTIMMQKWADYLDELRGGKVIPFPKVAG
jgi:integrase